MPAVTYYVALPYIRTEDGDFLAGDPKEMQSADAARQEAARMALGTAGAVAFSRTGDPSTGEFDEANVLATFGEVGDLGGHESRGRRGT
jgi:hypothetical protein